jgi:hypothetical protein
MVAYRSCGSVGSRGARGETGHVWPVCLFGERVRRGIDQTFTWWLPGPGRLERRDRSGRPFQSAGRAILTKLMTLGHPPSGCSD